MRYGTVTVVNAGPAALGQGGELLMLGFKVKPAARSGEIRFSARTELNDRHIPVKTQSASFTKAGLAFTLEPVGGYAAVGDDFDFTVTVEGAGGPLTYEWLFNGAPVGTNSPTFTIEDVAVEDTGMYTCRVSDTVETITSAPAEFMAVDSIPVASLGGLAMLGLATALAGVVVVRRRT